MQRTGTAGHGRAHRLEEAAAASAGFSERAGQRGTSRVRPRFPLRRQDHQPCRKHSRAAAADVQVRTRLCAWKGASVEHSRCCAGDSSVCVDEPCPSTSS